MSPPHSLSYRFSAGSCAPDGSAAVPAAQPASGLPLDNGRPDAEHHSHPREWESDAGAVSPRSSLTVPDASWGAELDGVACPAQAQDIRPQGKGELTPRGGHLPAWDGSLCHRNLETILQRSYSGSPRPPRLAVSSQCLPTPMGTRTPGTGGPPGSLRFAPSSLAGLPRFPRRGHEAREGSPNPPGFRPAARRCRG